jgi:hypothetical protein
MYWLKLDDSICRNNLFGDKKDNENLLNHQISCGKG